MPIDVAMELVQHLLSDLAIGDLELALLADGYCYPTRGRDHLVSTLLQMVREELIELYDSASLAGDGVLDREAALRALGTPESWSMGSTYSIRATGDGLAEVDDCHWD